MVSEFHRKRRNFLVIYNTMDLKSNFLPTIDVAGAQQEEHITVPAEALNNVNDQQQCLHVHLNEPAKVKIMCTPSQDLLQCSQNNFKVALEDGRMLTKWLNAAFPKARSLYIAVGVFIGWLFLAACNMLYPLLVQTRPVPVSRYDTSLSRFMILGSLSSLVLSGVLTQLYLKERKSNLASSPPNRSSTITNRPQSPSSNNGKIKMTKRSFLDDSQQHRIQEYKYYFM